MMSAEERDSRGESDTDGEQGDARFDLREDDVDLSDTEPERTSPADVVPAPLSGWRRVQSLSSTIAAAARPSPPFASFVSRQLHKYLLNVSMQETEEATGSMRMGAVLFSDASGFTALTERLAREENGAEMLCIILNDFFSRLINVVQEGGGDIVKFAGDALCIVWPVDPDDRMQAMSKDLRTATLRACSCAMEILATVNNYVAIDDPDPEQQVKLTLHMGIGCGELTAVHVGGVFNRWEYVLSGPAMSQIAIAEPLANSGEFVLSPEAWKLVRDVAEGTSVRELVENGLRPPEVMQHKDFIRLDSLKVLCKPSAPPVKLAVTPRVAELLQRYIPKAVLPRLASGQDGHLAEMRDVSVIFVNIHGISLEVTNEQSMEQVVRMGQMLMLEIQRTIYHWEGSINKLLVDDKGLLVLCALGLPPMPHSDDPTRAVATALDLVDNISGLKDGVSASAGVTTGRVFCGVVGSSVRREYTLMGDTVNLAARLMSKAEPGSVVVCSKTYRLCNQTMFRFKETGPFHLKGKTGEIPGFIPQFADVTAKAISASMTADHSGREEEVQQLKDTIEHLHARMGGTLVLTGERGSGKTHLAREIVAIGQALGMQVLERNVKPQSSSLKRASSSVLEKQYQKYRNSTDFSPKRPLSTSVETNDMFTAWQGVMEDLFKCVEQRFLRPEDDIETWATNVLKDADPTLVDLVPALPNLFPALQSKRWTQRLILPEDVPFDTLLEGLKTLIVAFSELTPTMIMLHLQTGTSTRSSVDPESWMLALRVTQHCADRSEATMDFCPLIVSIVTRPLFSLGLDATADIVKAAVSQDAYMKLKPLDAATRVKYAAQVMSAVSGMHVGLAALPPDLVQLLSDRAAGNPKHIAEMIKALLDPHVLGPDAGPAVSVMKNGRVKVNVKDLYRVPVPAKIRGTIKQEFDALRVRHQMVLKVASTFRCFTPSMVLDRFNAELASGKKMQRRHMLQDLNELTEAGVLERCPTSQFVLAYFPSDIFKESMDYTFASKLLQEEILRMMPSRWKSALALCLKERQDKVSQACCRIQSFFHRSLAKRRFSQTRQVWADAAKRIQRCFRRWRRVSAAHGDSLEASRDAARLAFMPFAARSFYITRQTPSGEQRRICVTRATGRKLPSLPTYTTTQA